MRRMLKSLRHRESSLRDDRESHFSDERDSDIFILNGAPLRLVPAERRPITPTATASTGHTADHAESLGTLARLPPELRRCVLVAAFGERTLHMDLRLTPCGQYIHRGEFSSADFEHGRGEAPLSSARRVSIPEPTTAKSAWSLRTKSNKPVEQEWEWRWYGCVCHRLAPRGSWKERITIARGQDPYQWPHRDTCLQGSGLCQLWPTGPLIDSSLNQSFATCVAGIGALGWLCASRQAYVEGMDVLYASNTFILQSRELLDALLGPPSPRNYICSSLPADHHLLPPQRLASVRALELRLEVVISGDIPDWNVRPHMTDRERSMMKDIPNLAGLLSPFPNLRLLILSFDEILWTNFKARPSGLLMRVVGMFLQPLAQALGPIAPQLDKPAVVELPSIVFQELDSLDLEKEQRDDCWSYNKGNWWLRYPIEDKSPYFYYIKQGAVSEGWWDDKGCWRMPRYTSFGL